MKILTAEQVREVDNFTIQHEPIPSIDLMERASESFVLSFTEKFGPENHVHIFCGTGNNGGDGMAIGRLFYDRGYTVSAYLVDSKANRSEDFQINFERLSRDIEIQHIDSPGDIPEILGRAVIIDAIFGSGLTRPVSGIHETVIDRINHYNLPIASVDISSGLFTDQSQVNALAVKSTFTISFQLPKLAFFIPENDEYVGEWEVVDIQLDDQYIQRQKTDHLFLNREFFLPLISKRKRHSHKGDFGKGLIIAGSYGKMGAAIMAGEAFMRSGAGLLTFYAPRCGYTILQSVVPEGMVLTSPDEFHISNLPALEDYDAIGIGPGIGTEKQTVDTLNRLFQLHDKPLVLDADALNILSRNRHLLELIPEHSILTPHPKEFERLTDTCEDGYQRLKKLKNFAQQIKCYVVLKGANTAVASPEGKVFFNSTGNPGMATGGSGDVLTGIITSLLAQHQSPYHAAVMGVYLHGLAGDLAKSEIGEESLIATDIINYLPFAFNYLHESGTLTN